MILGASSSPPKNFSDFSVLVLPPGTVAVGAAWNSDGENGDRATLTLSHGQTKLVESMFSLGKPVVLVLKGGRPFAIPEFYAQSAAVLSTSFLGQAAGQAIADVLFGAFNPGGRLMISVPYDAGSLPAFYIHRVTKPEIHIPHYLDIPNPVLSLGNAESTAEGRKKGTFSHGDTISFSLSITNTGAARF
ncbi:hypothetical protein CEP51_014415 [Fusarium floridanum]|uniref:beta-glucosidase n=1 Tax=Fusarium floridanum TaxID=1325733 RepID=A0A428PTF9_9HYPO|nr:hypothetical protein CEP51_014415 [Fusarium floridanum]